MDKEKRLTVFNTAYSKLTDQNKLKFWQELFGELLADKIEDDSDNFFNRAMGKMDNNKEELTMKCPNCGSIDIIIGKNEETKKEFLCKECGAYGVMEFKSGVENCNFVIDKKKKDYYFAYRGGEITGDVIADDKKEALEKIDKGKCAYRIWPENLWLDMFELHDEEGRSE